MGAFSFWVPGSGLRSGSEARDMLKELGLGALLFISGDSELGRRAGDALIADKIGDALEEGGLVLGP